MCTLVHCVCKSPSNKIIKTNQVTILDNHKKQEQQQDRRTRREHKHKRTHDKKKGEQEEQDEKQQHLGGLWAILFLTMSSVSRWLSGPSCLLQCHLSLGGSLGHHICNHNKMKDTTSRWRSGPSCFLQCHLSLGGSLGHLVSYNVICL